MLKLSRFRGKDVKEMVLMTAVVAIVVIVVVAVGAWQGVHVLKPRLEAWLAEEKEKRAKQEEEAKKRAEEERIEEIKSNIPESALEYKGHYYFVYDDADSWEYARDQCEELGGHLATITSAKENKKLYKYIRSEEYDRVYLGLYTDPESDESGWKWVTGEEMSYTNWTEGEPDIGDDEDCLYGTYCQEDKSKWRALNSTAATAYVCEWEVAETEVQAESENNTAALSNGMILHWDMSKDDNGTIKDLTSNHRDGIINGTVEVEQINGVDVLNLIEGNVEIPDGTIGPNDTELTVSMLVKITENVPSSWLWCLGSSDKRYIYFTGCSSQNGTNRGGAGYVPEQYIDTGNGWEFESVIEDDEALALDEWQNITVTFKEGKEYVFYKNGIKQSACNITEGAVGVFNLQDLMVAEDGRDGYMGGSFYAEDPAFKGMVADFRIYNQAMTEKQVSDLADEMENIIVGLEGENSEEAAAGGEEPGEEKEGGKEAEDKEEKQEGDYIIPDSSERYLDKADFEKLSKDELRLARNEIYAKNGRLFDDPDLQAYFDAKEWYQGSITPEDFDEESMLNDYEFENAKRISAYESEMGY